MSICDPQAELMPATNSTPEPEAAQAGFPAFVPHPWIKGAHRQTIIGRLLDWPRPRLAAQYAEVAVGSGDHVSVLDSVPAGWQAGDPAAILVHGLGGCARSSYMVRVGKRLVSRLGVRVVRMNLRGAGSGFGASRSYYHGGRSDDVRRVVSWLANRAPGSPIGLVGFSLGANIVLKLAGEAGADPVDQLDCVVAANPPVDLGASCRAIQQPRNRIYDRNFARLLCAQVQDLHRRFPDLGPIDLSPAQSLLAFDEVYTAPRNGFVHAGDYYRSSSAIRWIERIQIPGLVIHALDDPFIPAESFASILWPPRLVFEMVPHGGHLGYWSHRAWDGDRRWLDARIVHWFRSHWPRSDQPRDLTQLQ